MSESKNQKTAQQLVENAFDSIIAESLILSDDVRRELIETRSQIIETLLKELRIDSTRVVAVSPNSEKYMRLFVGGSLEKRVEDIRARMQRSLDAAIALDKKSSPPKKDGPSKGGHTRRPPK